MQPPIRLLLVEDNPADARLVQEAINDAVQLVPDEATYSLTVVEWMSAALESVDGGGIDVVLLDLALPDSSGFATFERMRERATDCAIVVLTQAADDALGARAVREGAQDYLVKSQVNASSLIRSIRYAFARKQSERDRLARVRAEGERALADAQRAALHSLFDDALDAMFIVDEASRPVDVNAAACALFGRSRDALLDMTLEKLIAPALEHLEGAALGTLRAGGERGEVALRRPDGSVRIAEYSMKAAMKRGTKLVVLRDVTEHREQDAERAVLHAREKEARAEADQQRARLRTLFEEAPVAVAVLVGPDHVFEVANARYEQMIGQRGLVGKPLRAAFLDARAHAPFGAVAEAVFASGETFEADEYRVTLDRRGDGAKEDVYLLLTCQPIKDDAHRVTAAILIAVDVTARVLARRDVAVAEASEAQFRGLADTMPQLVWRATQDGAHDYANERWCEFTGVSGQTGDGGFFDVIHAEDRERVRASWKEAVRTGEPFEAEHRVRRRDGVYRWFLGRALPLRETHGLEQGRVLLWFGTSTDIEDQKRAERSLSLLAEAGAALSAPFDAAATLHGFLRVMVPTLADWSQVWLMTGDRLALAATVHADPVEEARLLQASDRYAWLAPESLGAPEVVRSGIAELLEEITPPVRLAAALGDEHLAVRGDISAISAITVPLVASGRTLGAMSFVSSRSRFDRADLELAKELGTRLALALDSAYLFEMTQRERLVAEEANRAKDEFLSIASHELRAPLNAIVGWTSLLRAGALPEGKQSHALEVIARNANVQVQLIEDILDLNRLTTGKLTLKRVRVDAAVVVEAALDVVRLAADARGVSLDAHVAPDAGALHGDAERLQQLLWNLLANAVKFTPKGGRVRVDVKRAASHVEIAVSDNGQGIAPSFLPHVFEPFRQANGSSTRSHGGLGLGLSIVKHLVELHGGDIEATSEGPARGATFTVRLPLAPAGAQTNAPPSIAPPPAGALRRPSELEGLHVLVVDDEADARELIASILAECNSVTTTATSAAEAFDLIVAHRPDVLVSDIGMPGEDGFSLIRRVRALSEDRGGQTPAIALTGYARIEDRNRALREGFTSHLSKPVEPQELVAVIAAASQRAHA
jgi:PAS domain S-box-containing protein